MKLIPRVRVGRSPRRTAITLAAGVVVALSPALLPVTVAAEESEADPLCSPEELRELRSAADRFAAGCSELPAEYGSADDTSARNVEPDRIASKNMSLVANQPKRGAFAPEEAYNSDLAFKGNYAFAGNYNGFTVYDIANPRRPRPVTQVVCPGSQGDVSVYRNLLVVSVDERRTDSSCDSEPAANPPAGDYWEGLRVYNIKNPRDPKYVAGVETDCGSHTHSLAPSPNGQTLFAYVSSYSPNAALADCQPPHDKISVVKIPVGKAFQAKVATTPVLFPGGGNPGSPPDAEQPYSATSGCHDITTYPSKNIAAGACMGDGILMDIKNRYRPRVTAATRDTENFAFWHSATFNNNGTKVVFTDELGGGGAATCNPDVGPRRGANGIYNINQRGNLAFRSYYKMKRTQTNEENCVAHNGSLIPVKGRDIMVQAWYQGGISVYEFTNSAKPREIAWFDRGPLTTPEEGLQLGGSWSAYWHNGYVYSNDIQKGLDVLDVSSRGVQPAKKVRQGTNNPQAQSRY